MIEILVRGVGLALLIFSDCPLATVGIFLIGLIGEKGTSIGVLKFSSPIPRISAES